MWYVYILKSLSISTYFYKGLTDDIEDRLKRHIQRRERTTKDKGPFKLVHVELCEDRKYAREMEKYFKSGYGREIIKEIDESI